MNSAVRRYLLIFGACVLLAASAVAGTYAYQSIAQSAANETRGFFNGGVVHDDFLEPNKDVDVENSSRSVIYTRIRLDEYMEVGTVSLIADADINDMSSWTPHIPDACEEDCGLDFHSYWAWVMGGQKWYMPATAQERATGLAENNGIFDEHSPGAKQTQNAVVLTMEDWKALGSPSGAYWVIDTDGWCYWAAPLLPGEATGLLLDAVNLLRKPLDGYYYAINVVAQIATKDGTDKKGNPYNYASFGDGSGRDHTWTADGRALMEMIVVLGS